MCTQFLKWKIHITVFGPSQINLDPISLSRFNSVQISYSYYYIIFKENFIQQVLNTKNFSLTLDKNWLLSSLFPVLNYWALLFVEKSNDDVFLFFINFLLFCCCFCFLRLFLYQQHLNQEHSRSLMTAFTFT